MLFRLKLLNLKKVLLRQTKYMEDFQIVYLSRCAELAINPATELLNIFKKYEDSDKSDPYKDTLNLSGISIPLKSCTALAAALSNNNFFTKIIVSDSFLGDDGIFNCILLLTTLSSTNRMY